MVTEHDFTYCPKCGNTFEKKWSNLLVCGRCDLHFYINPRPTNGVIFENEEGEILFIKRKYPPKKGFLDVPGGFVDLNESIEESVVREIREELGFVLKDFTYFNSYKDRYAFKGVNYHTVCSMYSASLSKDRVPQKTIGEGTLVWVKKEKIPYEKVAFKGVIQALKDYQTRS